MIGKEGKAIPGAFNKRARREDSAESGDNKEEEQKTQNPEV